MHASNQKPPFDAPMSGASARLSQLVPGAFRGRSSAGELLFCLNGDTEARKAGKRVKTPSTAVENLTGMSVRRQIWPAAPGGGQAVVVSERFSGSRLPGRERQFLWSEPP